MRKLVVKLCLGALALLSSSIGVAATVTIAPSNANPAIGSTFTVTIHGDSFPQTGGATLGLSFNSAVVSFVSAALPASGSFGSGSGASLALNPPSGTPSSFDILAPSFGTPPSGSFDAAVFTFQAIAAGSATIQFIDNQNDQLWFDANTFDTIPVTYTQADVVVAGVSGPGIAVTDSVTPADDRQVPFGNVTELTSATQSVTVTNSGNQNRQFGTLAQVDTLAAPFSLVNDNCSGHTLAPAGSCTVNVRFSPASAGAVSDSFDIPSDDPDEPAITVSISGTGIRIPGPLSYTQTSFVNAPGAANQMVYSSPYNKLVLRNSGSAVRVLDLTTGSVATILAESRFTDMSLSPGGRYVYVADYGNENIGYGTPATPSRVGRIDLVTGAWESKPTSAVAYHIEATDADHFILTSFDQWITFTYNAWGTGSSITILNSPGCCGSGGYYASVFFGDIEYDTVSGRLLHGNSNLSSHEITAFRLSNNNFIKQESSGGYGSADAYGGTSVLATDGSSFYYGRLQVEGLDVRHNRHVYPEYIYAATGRAAFGDGTYYDPATGQLLGSLGVSTTAYGLNKGGDDFWAYDLAADVLRHFAPSDSVTPPGPKANFDIAATALATGISIDILANDTGFGDPVTVTISTPPSHGTATLVGSPGNKAGIRVLYTPTGSYTGSDSFVYQVSDGVNTDSASASIAISKVKANNDSYVVLRNSYNDLHILANDAGFTDPVTVSIINYPNHNGYASVDYSPGARSAVYINYQPSSYNAPPGDYTENFSYQVTDSANNKDTATVAVQVVTFRAMDDTASTNVDTPVIINAGANDLGFNDPVTMGLYVAPMHGSATVNSSSGYWGSRSFTYTPQPGYLGTDTFQYAMDDGVHIGIATVTVNVIHDADGDSVADEVDNCTTVPNSDQRDTDGDSYGNLCDADLNSDGGVNFRDLAIFHQKFATHDPDADFNGDGIVNFADLARFRLLFGRPPGLSGLHPLCPPTCP